MNARTCIGCGYVCEADCIDADGRPYKGCGRGCRLLTLAQIGAKATVAEACTQEASPRGISPDPTHTSVKLTHDIQRDDLGKPWRCVNCGAKAKTIGEINALACTRQPVDNGNVVAAIDGSGAFEPRTDNPTSKTELNARWSDDDAELQAAKKLLSELAARDTAEAERMLADVLRQYRGRRVDYPTCADAGLPDRGGLINDHARACMRLYELSATLPEVEKLARKTPRKDMPVERAKVEAAKARVEPLRAEIRSLGQRCDEMHARLSELGAYGPCTAKADGK